MAYLVSGLLVQMLSRYAAIHISVVKQRLARCDMMKKMQILRSALNDQSKRIRVSTLVFLLFAWFVCSISAFAQTPAPTPPLSTYRLPSLFADSKPLVLPEPMGVLVAPATEKLSPAILLAAPQQARFQPWQLGKALATSPNQHVWLRLVIPATAQPQTWILRIPRITLDKATLYYTSAQEAPAWKQQSAGLRLPRSEWPMRAADPAFELTTQTAQAQLFFIQIEHRQPVTESIQLIINSEFSDSANHLGALYGLIFGVFGVLTMASLISASINRSSHFAWMALFCFTVMLAQLTVSGYMSLRIWPDSVYLSGTMGWVVPLLSLAALARLVLSVSYARELSKTIYFSLWALIVACFLLVGVTLLMPLEASRNFLNPFFALGMLISLGSLAWIAWRSQHWLWGVAISIAPVTLSVMARLAYNMGWVAHVELALLAGVITAGLGLLMMFTVLYLHQHERVSSRQRHLAVENIDAPTGLFNERIALTRFPQILLRSKRFDRPCGAVLVRWLDFDHVMKNFSLAERGRIFSHLGNRLNRLARDIDTVARIGDDMFIFLIEAPITRENISALSSQILTTCMRPSSMMLGVKGYDLHLAVWLSDEVLANADQALELLKTRIDQMRVGTQRRVQFVDTALSTGPQSEKKSLEDSAKLVAKINSLEATQGLPTLDMRPRLQKP